jgi:hypothetical protein
MFETSWLVRQLPGGKPRSKPRKLGPQGTFAELQVPYFITFEKIISHQLFQQLDSDRIYINGILTFIQYAYPYRQPCRTIKCPFLPEPFSLPGRDNFRPHLILSFPALRQLTNASSDEFQHLHRDGSIHGKASSTDTDG